VSPLTLKGRFASPLSVIGVRLEIVAEANRLLAARDKPTLSEAEMIYRIGRTVHQAINRRVDWLPLK
jgi:hypothetical protein